MIDTEDRTCAFSIFYLVFTLDWEDISNTQYSVFEHIFKHLVDRQKYCVSYFQLSSQWLEMWSNTVCWIWLLRNKTAFTDVCCKEVIQDIGSSYMSQNNPSYAAKLVMLVSTCSLLNLEVVNFDLTSFWKQKITWLITVSMEKVHILVYKSWPMKN